MQVSNSILNISSFRFLAKELVLSFGGGTAWNFSMDQSSRTRRQWNRNQPFSNKKGCGIKNRSGEKYIPQNVDR